MTLASILIFLKEIVLLFFFKWGSVQGYKQLMSYLLQIDFFNRIKLEKHIMPHSISTRESKCPKSETETKIIRKSQNFNLC